MAIHTGYLTIFSSDRSEIYGEFADAQCRDERSDGGVNHVFSGKAGDGALATFQRLDQEGISNVSFKFESEGEQYDGSAQLLAPKVNVEPGESIIQIESVEQPV